MAKKAVKKKTTPLWPRSTPKEKKPAPDPLIARISDLETMNDTLFKRTSELAQSIVTLVDNVVELQEQVIAEGILNDNMLERVIRIENLLEIKL